MSKAEGIRLFLLGALVALVAVAIWRPNGGSAQAQAVVGQSSYQIWGTNNGTNLPVLYIFDPGTRRFAYYTQRNATQPNEFKLYVVRGVTQDFQTDDLAAKNANGMSVDDVRKALNLPRPR